MNAKKWLLPMALTCCFVAQTIGAAAFDMDVKNFILQPEIKRATFEDGADAVVNGVIDSDFLSLSSDAATSRVETEDNGNSYLVLEDNVDNTSDATLTLTMPGGSAHEKFIFEYDICIPTSYIGRNNPNNTATTDAVPSAGIDFYGTDKEKGGTARVSYYTFSRHANNGTRWVYTLADVTKTGDSYTWLGGNGMAFDTWHTVRYEVNVKTHRYNVMITERDTGSLVAKELNRYLRDSKNSVNSTMINYYMPRLVFKVSARNNGSAVQMLLDNIGVAKESFHTPSKPEISVTDDGVVTANVTVNNETLTDLPSPVLVLGIYGTDNKLVDVAFDCVPATAMTSPARLTRADLSCSLTKPILGSNFEARAMLVTSLFNSKPLWPTEILPLP